MTDVGLAGSGKLFIPIVTTTQSPPVANTRIVRPRLIEKLQSAVEVRLVLIKAPAGYGKTTLAVDWSEELRASGQRIAWVRAERENDEPVIFLHYVATAIEQACPGTGRPALDLIAERVMPPPHALVAALINALAESGEELCLFVDDFHLIESPETYKAFWFLLQNAPRHFHVVLTTREEPPLPLGILRARGELFETGADELRFSLEETKRLLLTEEFSELDESSINALQRDTGGWAAALRMACSSLRAGVGPSECLHSNQGCGHAVETFLAELMLRLPEPYYDFMLGSSILKSMSADQCNEVMAIKDSEKILDLLFHRYQLINLDTSRSDAYCYHPLVGDFLQQRLRRDTTADKVRNLHLRAAHWYVRNDLPTEAIRHAVSAEERELAAQWTEQCAMELLKDGNISIVLSWRRWLPRDLMRWQLPLRLVIGWSLFLAAQRAEATAWVDEIEADLVAGMPDPDHRGQRECLAIRTCIATFSDDLASALALGQRYMAASPADPWIDNVVGNCLFFCHLMAGRHDLADQLAWREMSAESRAHAIPARVYRLVAQGLSNSHRLRFAEAEANFRKAGEMAASGRGSRSSLAAIPAVLLAHQLYECDRIDEAEQLIENRLEAINVTGFLDCQMRAYIVLARIAYRSKDNAEANRLLDRADDIASLEQWPRMQAALLVERLRLFLDEGNLAAARNCLAKVERLALEGPPDNACIRGHIHGYMHLARAFMSIDEARFEAPAESLESVWSGALAAAHNYFAARVGTLQAIALFASQQQERALSRFMEVLALGLEAGMIRSIVDSGPKVGAVINFAHQRIAGESNGNRFADYLQRLMRACESSWTGSEVRSLQTIPEISPLTSRESDVLRLIADGQSNKRVAQMLGVSPETVKTHIKNIFTKLKVDNRMQAVVHARRLGLLE